MAPVIGFKSQQESRHRYKFWATLLGVITGNSAAATHVALEHVGIEKYFDHGYFGEDAASRADLVAAAATDYPGAVVVASHDRWLRRRWSGDELALTPLAASAA